MARDSRSPASFLPQRRLRCLPVVLLIACAGSSGCAAAAVGALGAGAAGVAYAVGDVERTYPYPLGSVWDASQVALAELQIAPGFDVQDEFKGRIDRRTSTGDRVRITLARRGEFTDVKVRVNTFGDKWMSQHVAQTIERHLYAGAGSEAVLSRSDVSPVPAPEPLPADSEANAWPESMARGE